MVANALIGWFGHYSENDNKIHFDKGGLRLTAYSGHLFIVTDT